MTAPSGSQKASLGVVDMFTLNPRCSETVESILGLISQIDTSQAIDSNVGNLLASVANVFGATACDFWIYDDVFNRIWLYATTFKELQDAQQNRLLEIGHEFATKLKAAAAAFSARRHEDANWAPEVLYRQNVLSLHIVPVGRPVIGFITVDDSEDFDLENKRLLFTTASKVLFDLFRHHQRTIEDRAFTDILMFSSTTDDFGTFLQKIISSTLKIAFDCIGVSLFLVNEAKDKLICRATTSLENIKHFQDLWYAKNEGFTGWVWDIQEVKRFPADPRNCKALIKAIAYMGDPPPPKSSEVLPANTDRQILLFPLVCQQEAIGVIRICGRKENRPFTQFDEDVAKRIGELLGTVISKNQALSRIRQIEAALFEFAKATEIDYETSHVLFFLATVLTSDHGFGYNRAVVWLMDPSSEQFVPYAAVGSLAKERAVEVWQKCAGMSLGQIFSDFNLNPDRIKTDLLKGVEELSLCYTISDKPDILSLVYKNHTKCQLIQGEAKGHTEAVINGPLFDLLGVNDCVFYPLLFGQECIGVVYLDNAFDGKPIMHPFEDRLSSLLTQSAEAVTHSVYRIMDQKKQTFVSRISDVFSGPQFSLDSLGRGALLRDILKNVVFNKLTIPRGILYHYDSRDSLLRVVAAYGIVQESEDELRFSTGDSKYTLVAPAVNKRALRFIPFAEDDESLNPYWKKRLGLQGPLLVMPLMLADEPFGALVLNGDSVTEPLAKQITTFTEEIYFLTQALVIQKKANEDARLIDTLGAMQSMIQEAQFDEKYFLDRITRRLMELFGAQASCIYRPVYKISHLTFGDQGSTGKFQRVASINYPLENNNEIREPATGCGMGLTNHVLSGETVRCASVEDDERWSRKESEFFHKFLGSPIRSFLGVPIFDSERQIAGAITLTRARKDKADGLAFSMEEEHLVKSMANAISVTINLMKVEQNLKSANEQFRAILDAAPEEISVVDTDYRIRYINAEKRMMFSEDGEILGRHCYDVYEKTSQICRSCPIERAMAGAKTGNGEHKVFDNVHIGTPKGKPAYRASVMASAIIVNGQVIGGIELVRNRDKVEEDLNQHAGSAAHLLHHHFQDLKTTIDELKYKAQNRIHIGPDLAEKLTTQVDEARTAVEKCVVTTLPPPLHPDVFSLGELIENARVEQGIHKKYLKVKKGKNLLKKEILCDRERIVKDVLGELFNNAKQAKLGNNVEIEIELSLWQDRDSDYGITIEFKDFGRGVMKGLETRIFEKGFSENGSYGWGLYIMQTTVHRHGGTIRLVKNIRPTCFQLRMPYKAAVKDRNQAHLGVI